MVRPLMLSCTIEGRCWPAVPPAMVGIVTTNRRISTSKRRGRPVGTIGLTPEIERRILAYIEAGAFDYIAAEAAGIDDRTFRDWMARGEGRHPSRPWTPELERFAAHVREAKARARAGREIEVAEQDPKFWLGRAARSRPGREGWTDPVPDPVPEAPEATVAAEPSVQELAETVRLLIEAGVIDPWDTERGEHPHEGTRQG